MVNLFDKAKWGNNSPKQKLEDAIKVAKYLGRKNRRALKAKKL